MSSDISAAGEIPAPPPGAAPATAPVTRGDRACHGRRPTAAAAAWAPRHRTGRGRPARAARRLIWLTWAGIGVAILIMVAVSLVRGGWMRPPLVLPAGGPPWELPVRHVSADVVTYLLWFAAVASAGGVVAGLLAVRRGVRLNARLLLIIGLITVAVLTVLPPAGSTDSLDYATYGRLCCSATARTSTPRTTCATCTTRSPGPSRWSGRSTSACTGRWPPWSNCWRPSWAARHPH